MTNCVRTIKAIHDGLQRGLPVAIDTATDDEIVLGLAAGALAVAKRRFIALGLDPLTARARLEQAMELCDTLMPFPAEPGAVEG